MKTIYERLYLKFGAICSLVLAGGCATSSVKNELAESWANQMEEYQIIPVFPPSAEFQIGDVWVTCPRKPGSYVSNARLVVRPKGIKQALVGFYTDSISYPQTVFPDSKTLGEEKSPAGNSKSPSEKQVLSRVPAPPIKTDLLTGNGDLTAMRAVVFPDFFSASVSGKQAGITLPAGIVAAGFGISSNQITSKSMSVPRAETMHLPYEKIPLTDQEKGYAEDVRSSMETTTCANAGTIVITQIFVARAIDTVYSFEEKAASSLRAAFQPPVAGTTRATTLESVGKFLGVEQQTQTAAPAKDTQSGAGAGVKEGAKTGTGTSGNGATAEQTNKPPTVGEVGAYLQGLKEGLNETLADSNRLTTRSFIGVDGAVYRGTSNGFSMHQELSAPVVIGYRGIQLYEIKPAVSRHTSSGNGLSVDQARAPEGNRIKQDDSNTAASNGAAQQQKVGKREFGHKPAGPDLSLMKKQVDFGFQLDNSEK